MDLVIFLRVIFTANANLIIDERWVEATKWNFMSYHLKLGTKKTGLSDHKDAIYFSIYDLKSRKKIKTLQEVTENEQNP